MENLDAPPRWLKTKEPQYYVTKRDVNQTKDESSFLKSLEEDVEKIKSKPWYKLTSNLRQIRNFISRYYYRFWMKLWQHVDNWHKGFGFFPDEDGFEFYVLSSRHALPRLRYLRSFARNYPVNPHHDGGSIKPVIFEDTNITPHENDVMWHDVLDHIIFSMK